MKTMIIIASLLVSSLAFAKKDCENYDKYNDVSMNEMKTIVAQNKATIVDVNSENSYKKSHIPGAVHYTADASKMTKALPENKDALIVAYCGGKSCTAWKRAAKFACEKGYTNIKHFSEGIKGWNKRKKG